MNTEQTGKIKAVSIWLNRAEGPTDECGQVEFQDVNVWQRADMMLRAWSETSPKDDTAYNKIKFKVTYADGETYIGRIAMRHWSVQVPSVAGQMRYKIGAVSTKTFTIFGDIIRLNGYETGRNVDLYKIGANVWINPDRSIILRRTLTGARR
jgi:hypothetical protein